MLRWRLFARATFLWGWLECTQRDGLKRFLPKSFTDPDHCNARKKTEHIHLHFRSSSFSICVGGCQHDLLPLAITKVLAKLLSRLGATEQGTGARLPMLLQWPLQSIKEEGLGICRPSCAGSNFLSVTDHHACRRVCSDFSKPHRLLVQGTMLIPAFRG